MPINSAVNIVAPAEVCTTVAEMVADISNSKHFDKEAIRQEPLSFSQAYCLLWQVPSTGPFRQPVPVPRPPTGGVCTEQTWPFLGRPGPETGQTRPKKWIFLV